MKTDSLIKTGYIIEVDGVQRGFVWSVNGFSYRGTQGWNRGIRCQDFHPIEWHQGVTLGSYSLTYQTRLRAVQAFLRNLDQ